MEELKGQMPDFAKDLRLDLSSMVSDETLGDQNKLGLFLACAEATRNPYVMSHFETIAIEKLKGSVAASLMAMNNVYYRFVHLASNKEYGAMPTRLRMSRQPRCRQTDFELWSLAVSTINGCSAGIDAHEKVLTQA